MTFIHVYISFFKIFSLSQIPHEKNQMNWIIIKRKDGDERVRGYLHSRWARVLQTFARTKYNFDGGMFLLLPKYFPIWTIKTPLQPVNGISTRNINHIIKTMQILFKSLLNTYPQCICLCLLRINILPREVVKTNILR